MFHSNMTAVKPFSIVSGLPLGLWSVFGCMYAVVRGSAAAGYYTVGCVGPVYHICMLLLLLATWLTCSL